MSEFIISNAGRRFAAGVIVGTNDRLGELLQSGVDYFANNGKCLINGANGSINDVDNAVIAIEIDNLKNLCLEVAKLWHDDIHNILGRGNLLLPGGHIILPMETQYDRQTGRPTD